MTYLQMAPVRFACALIAAAFVVMTSNPAVKFFGPTSRAIVTAPVESLLAAPDASASVVSQTILGECVSVLQQTAPSANGFVEITTGDGYRGWVAAASLCSWPAEGPAYATVDDATIRVASVFANIYSEPDFTKGKPLMRLTMGTRLEAAGIIHATTQTHGGFVKIKLPSRAIAYIPKGDVDLVPFLYCRVPSGPQAWISLGKQLIGTPYTWGGTTPEGFDCSGLIQFLLKQYEIVIKRDAHDQCFNEPRLEPVAITDLKPGDLLYFGDASRITHVGMYLGVNLSEGYDNADKFGEVLEATRAGRPGVKISKLSEPRLKDSLQHARRVHED